MRISFQRTSIQHNSIWLFSNRLIGLSLLLIISLINTGCSSNPGGQGIVYVPPTPAATRVVPTLTPAATSSGAARPTPTPPCRDNLVFLEDLSIPDGTVVTPREVLDKRWEVENSGSCNWDRNYSLQLIAGQEMGAGERQALFPARSGTIAVIRVVFAAPAEAGIYRSAWQAYSPDDEPFGDPIFIEIEVAGTAEEDGGG